jgi:hypothetical protein
MERWNTESEIEFISSIGNHRTYQAKRITNLTRLERLKRYRGAMVKRTDWGHIDPMRVLFFVDGLI